MRNPILKQWLALKKYSDEVGVLIGSCAPVRLHWDSVWDHSMPGQSLSAELLLRLSPYLDSKALFKRSQEFLLFAPHLCL